MSVAETAEALGVSPATLKRDWTVARAYHRYARRLLRDRAILLLRRGDPVRAVARLDSVAAFERDVLPLPHFEHGHTLRWLGEASLAAGDAARAAAVLREALAQLVRLTADQPDNRTVRRLCWIRDWRAADHTRAPSHPLRSTGPGTVIGKVVSRGTGV